MFLEDEKILILFRKDPEKALGILYDKYFDYLSREIFFILKDEEDTRDVIQDLFLGLWRNQDYIQNINSSLKSYLKKAALNKSINIIRTKIQYQEVDNEVVTYDDYDQHSEMVMEELELQVSKAIDELPGKCRSIFILSRYEDRTYREISDDLDISVKTVENQISKALKILRNKLTSDRGKS